MGLEGQLPDTVDPEAMPHRIIEIRTNQSLNLGGERNIHFDNDHLRFLKDKVRPFHSNALEFVSLDTEGKVPSLSTQPLLTLLRFLILIIIILLVEDLY